MSQKLNLGILGLNTNSNSTSLPDGSIVNCANVNFDRKLAEGRRGFTRHSTKANIDKITEYQNKLIVHTSGNVLSYYNSGWNNYATSITAPLTTQKINFVQANQNLYFTSSTGINVLDAYSAAISNTGMPKGLDSTAVVTGGSGFLADNVQVAYRIVWGTRDANNNLYLGAPSQRIICVASAVGHTSDVSITFTIPSGIATTDFYQIYRSAQSAGVSTVPTDDLQLVYESNPTAGQITAKSITVTDSTSDLLRVGAYLYTNANQEGITESNDIPPLAVDVAEFKGFTFFGNIKTKHFIDISLLGVSGSGLVANDTITINSMVFTAKAATTVASREFKVFTTGSVSQNIDDTARELVKVINQYTSNTTIYAYYVSEYEDLPGKIMIEERILSSSAFTVSVSRVAAWSLPNSGTSENSNYQNGLMWSKIQQPEHVPFSHLELVGSKSYAIKRIIALKDALFILKEDGVFRLTGVNGSWSIETLDSSTYIIAPDSAVVINNQIYCLANQGVVSISDSGVQVIGEEIKDEIQKLIGYNYSVLQTTTTGVGYETDRKYILNVITESTDTNPTQSFIYNVFTAKWSRWDKPTNAAFVAPSVDKLYFCDSSYLLEERKSFTYRDSIDEEFGSYSVVSYSGKSVVLNSVVGITIGDMLYESSTIYSPILSINGATNTVTVNDSNTWSIAAVTLLSGINSTIEWAPQYCDNSGLEKAFEELMIMFKVNRFTGASMDFFTDINSGFESITISGEYGGGDWGLFPWGTVPWGGISKNHVTRCSVPRNKSRGQSIGIRFSCRMAYSQFSIEGLSLQFDYVSERMGVRV